MELGIYRGQTVLFEKADGFYISMCLDAIEEEQYDYDLTKLTEDPVNRPIVQFFTEGSEGDQAFNRAFEAIQSEIK